MKAQICTLFMDEELHSSGASNTQSSRTLIKNNHPSEKTTAQRSKHSKNPLVNSLLPTSPK